MFAKMGFFHDSANILSEFLTKFQTDNPVMPFLSDLLESILRRLMKFFILAEVIKAAATAYKLIKLDVFDKNMRLPVSSVKLTTATEAFRFSEGISASEKSNFRQDCIILLSRMISKLQERSPLKYQIVRCTSFIAPTNLINEKDECILKFSKIVEQLCQRKLLPSKEADDSKLQFEEFIDNVVNCCEKFLSFSICSSSLDAFYGQWLHRNPKFSSLWKVMICIFTFSHGQSQIARGFNINKSLLVENMYEKSICAQRLVSDFVKSSNKEVHEIEIENELILSCKAAHSKYKIDLEDAASSSTNDEKSRQREMSHDEIEGVKCRKVEIEAFVESWTKDLNTYYDRAENESDMSLLIKANAIRKSISLKQELIRNLDLAIKKLEEEKKTSR